MIGIAEGFGSSIPEPGHVHHEGMRLIRIGEMDGGLTARVQGLKQTWREAGFNVKAFADVHRMIWEKFLCNVTLSAPCAVFDVTVGELMADPGDVEGGARLHGRGLPARPGQGRRVPLRRPAALRDRFRRHHPNSSPSMRLDHLARRRSEVDVINGQVVTLQPRARTQAPYNETLCAVLRRREATFD